MKKVSRWSDGRTAVPVNQTASAEVVAFIKAHPGAVGYVSAALVVGDEVKVIEVVE